MSTQIVLSINTETFGDAPIGALFVKTGARKIGLKKLGEIATDDPTQTFSLSQASFLDVNTDGAATGDILRYTSGGQWVSDAAGAISLPLTINEYATKLDATAALQSGDLYTLTGDERVRVVL